MLVNTKNQISKDKNGENVSHLETAEVVLVHCNIVNNDYQLDSKVLYTFVPNKTFGSLLETSPTNFIFLKVFSSEFSKVEVWLLDQNSQPLETEDWMNLTLAIKSFSYYENALSRDRIYAKGYGFLSFPKNIGKNMSNKYCQKLVNSTKTSTKDAIKTASKKAVQKQQKQLAI